MRWLQGRLLALETTVLVMKLLRTPTHARDRSGRRWLSRGKQCTMKLGYQSSSGQLDARLRDRDVAFLVECLCGIDEALSSIPRAT